MYKRPWLAVAVYARAPVALAPMDADIAANSDSTLTNSHGESSPVLTSCERFSTMCVCGEIGYAQITSGRHNATASATAREPSSWRGTAQLLQLVSDPGVRGLRGSDIALRYNAGETLADCACERVERDQSAERREAAEQGSVRDSAGGCANFTRKLRCRHSQQPLVVEAR